MSGRPLLQIDLREVEHVLFASPLPRSILYSLKNAALTASDVVPGSNRNVWWQCQVDPTHEWQAVVYERVKGRGCPVCSGYRVTPTNSLQALYPQLAQEWHPTKNGTLTPDQFKPGSNQNVWWQCLNDP